MPTSSGRARRVGDALPESLVQHAVAFILAPLKLKVSNHDAVAFAGAGGVERGVDAGHFEHATKALVRLKVVPVCHLGEPFDGFALDDECVRGVGDGEILNGFAVGGSKARVRDFRLPLVDDGGSARRAA